MGRTKEVVKQSCPIRFAARLSFSVLSALPNSVVPAKAEGV